MASYSDNFNRPDSTNIGSWTEIDDNWSIISNQLAPGTTTLGLVVYQSPLATVDHYAEIVLSVAGGVSSGVFARSDITANTFYLWRNSGTAWNLFSNIGGNFVSIGSYAAPAVNGDVARIECIGSTIKGYVNGVERVSATDTSIPTGQYVGLRSEASSSARYDNFLAADNGTPPVVTNTGAFLDFM
jgi:hypothetical protein